MIVTYLVQMKGKRDHQLSGLSFDDPDRTRQGQVEYLCFLLDYALEDIGLFILARLRLHARSRSTGPMPIIAPWTVEVVGP